jgi:hypothetical protein
MTDTVLTARRRLGTRDDIPYANKAQRDHLIEGLRNAELAE